MYNDLYKTQWFDKDYSIHIFAYYFKSWDNYVMPVQIHDRIEIMYVIKGECTLEAEGQKYQLKNGDFILLNADVPHRIIMKKDEHCRMLNAEFGFVEKSSGMSSVRELLGEEFLNTELFRDKKSHIVFKDSANVYSYLKTLVAEVSKNGGVSSRIVQLQIAQLILKIAELYSEHQYNTPIKSIIHIRKSVSYINTHYFDDIKIDKLAEYVGVHTNYLQRIFREHMEKTLVEYITDVRIEKAKELLSSTDIAIVDLCLYVGINSRQYFTYLFKKNVGMTPRQYRKSFIKQSNN